LLRADVSRTYHAGRQKKQQFAASHLSTPSAFDSGHWVGVMRDAQDRQIRREIV
jgi:hypothetical protein